uniref:Uncharacterized protein n=1 Tax=Rangifer tarandus platyrhynchus TaxID=3082113 RepID=A0ACB0DPU3_RANTA|nr:unnamed protein product [Rangifer tarandus platyrhynchus]
MLRQRLVGHAELQAASANPGGGRTPRQAGEELRVCPTREPFTGPWGTPPPHTSPSPPPQPRSIPAEQALSTGLMSIDFIHDSSTFTIYPPPEALPPNAVTLGIRISTHKFCGDSDIQTRAGGESSQCVHTEAVTAQRVAELRGRQSGLSRAPGSPSFLIRRSSRQSSPLPGVTEACAPLQHLMVATPPQTSESLPRYRLSPLMRAGQGPGVLPVTPQSRERGLEKVDPPPPP